MGLGTTWRTREARSRIGQYVLAATIPLSALGVGALRTPVLAASAVLAAIGTLLLWLDDEPLEPRPAATVLVATAGLLLAWTLLQVIPLPFGVVAAIAPENADVWSRALAPLREAGPKMVSLSLEPTATRIELLRGVTYLAVFVGALRIARRREGVVFLERVLVVSSIAVAAAALVHPVLGARKAFGIGDLGETPAGAPELFQRLSPFLNTNHLAAYVNIGAMIAFAGALERRSAFPRPIAIVLAVLLSATTVWSLSRGGTATLIIGAALAVTLSFAARRSKLHRLAGPAAFVAVAGGSVVVLLLATFDDFRTKVARNDLSKIDLVKNAFGLVREHPLFGVGRGAFESTFPKLRTGTDYLVFTHPENVVAQWITEWGLPVGLVGLVAIAWALRPKTVLARSRPPVGPWAALVAVGLHNLCDFSSEVPGVMIALSFCAAIVAGGTGGARPRAHRAPTWTSRPTLVAYGLALLVAAALAATVPFIPRELYSEQRAVRDAALDRRLSREAFREQLKAAMLRHPAEAYFPFVGAVRATVTHDESVVPWAGRALERSPVYGRAHLLLARSLFGRNRSQARLEYRTACLQDGWLCTLDEALPLVGSYEDAMELVPDGAVGIPVLLNLTSKLAARLPSTVARLDRELAERDPKLLEPVERIASRALGDVTQGEAWCASATSSVKTPCIEAGLAAANRLRAFAPEKCEGHALAAELRVAGGDIDAGYAELDRSLDQVERRAVCARRLVDLAVKIGNAPRIDMAIDRLLKLGCDSQAECVENYRFVAGVEDKRGALRHALALVKKAWERAPERDDLLVDLASRAAAQGSHGEALEAYLKLADRHPDEKQWADAVTEQKDAIARGMFERR